MKWAAIEYGTTEKLQLQSVALQSASIFQKNVQLKSTNLHTLGCILKRFKKKKMQLESVTLQSATNSSKKICHFQRETLNEKGGTNHKLPKRIKSGLQAATTIRDHHPRLSQHIDLQKSEENALDYSKQERKEVFSSKEGFGDWMNLLLDVVGVGIVVAHGLRLGSLPLLLRLVWLKLLERALAHACLHL